MAYYAWAPIVYGADVDDRGNILSVKRLEINDSVDAGTLGIEDDVFQTELVETGAVRDQQLPDDLLSSDRSPRQLAADKIVAQQQEFELGDIPPVLLMPPDTLYVPPEETEEVTKPAATKASSTPAPE